MYAANIIGAGVPGLLMTVAPTWAIGSMFTAPRDRVTFGMLGAIWLAIGIVSAFGLRFPLQFTAVFVVQIVYKAIWLIAVALPLLAGGDQVATVIPFALFFAIIVASYLIGTPFAYLLARRTAPPR